MSDATQYNPTVSFRIKITSVFILTPEGVNPATYRLSYTVEGVNDLGATEAVLTTYFLVDFIGTYFSILVVGSGTLDVEDSFRTGECPTNGNTGIICKSIWSGRALIISSYSLQFLHPLAKDRINQYNLDILWSNDPNAREIELDPTTTPQLTGYQDDRIDGTNLAQDYGNTAEFSLWQTLSTTQKIKRTEQPNITYTNATDKLIDTVDFGILWESMTGLIIKISKS